MNLATYRGLAPAARKGWLTTTVTALDKGWLPTPADCNDLTMIAEFVKSNSTSDVMKDLAGRMQFAVQSAEQKHAEGYKPRPDHDTREEEAREAAAPAPAPAPGPEGWTEVDNRNEDAFKKADLGRSLRDRHPEMFR
jgi:hypothetical protein